MLQYTCVIWNFTKKIARIFFIFCRKSTHQTQYLNRYTNEIFIKIYTIFRIFGIFLRHWFSLFWKVKLIDWILVVEIQKSNSYMIILIQALSLISLSDHSFIHVLTERLEGYTKGRVSYISISCPSITCSWLVYNVTCSHLALKEFLK